MKPETAYWPPVTAKDAARCLAENAPLAAAALGSDARYLLNSFTTPAPSRSFDACGPPHTGEAGARSVTSTQSSTQPTTRSDA